MKFKKQAKYFFECRIKPFGGIGFMLAEVFNFKGEGAGESIFLKGLMPEEMISKPLKKVI